MRMLRTLLRTRFRAATLAVVILAGWAAWTGGLLDGQVARQVRSAPTWIAPEFGVDPAQANQIIGNRRLVVILREPSDERARDVCKSVDSAADGSVILVLTRDGNSLDRYGCATMYSSDADIGKANVVEDKVASGLSGFADRPLDALRIAAVNYDGLVRIGFLPEGARVIAPSFPRYLLALVALGAVLTAAAGTWLLGRRAGRETAARGIEREQRGDLRDRISTVMTGIAQDVIDLDTRQSGDPDYRLLVADYTDLMADVAAHDGRRTPTGSSGHLNALYRRARALARRSGNLASAGDRVDLTKR